MTQQHIEAEDAVKEQAHIVRMAERAVQEGRCESLAAELLSKLEEDLSRSTSQLAALTTSLEMASKRQEPIRHFNYKTRVYKVLKAHANRQEALVRWILQQIPQIELELRPDNNSNACPVERRGRKRKSDDLNKDTTSEPNVLATKRPQRDPRSRRADILGEAPAPKPSIPISQKLASKRDVVHKNVRRSRRLGGHSPELGLLPAGIK